MCRLYSNEHFGSFRGAGKISVDIDNNVIKTENNKTFLAGNAKTTTTKYKYIGVNKDKSTTADVMGDLGKRIRNFTVRSLAKGKKS